MIADSFVNEKSGRIRYIEIDGLQAILVEYEGDKAMYSLTWQDDQYRYSIWGSFFSANEIIRIAEGVILK